MFKKKGFKKVGSNPSEGKGAYINPKTNRKYYIDKGQDYGRKGKEYPHVDVHRGTKSNKNKRKYPLGDKLKDK